MARVEVTVTNISSEMQAATLVSTNGNYTLGMQIDGRHTIPVHLMIANTHTGTVAFELAVRQIVGGIGTTFPQFKTYSAPAAVAGIEGVFCLVLDMPAFVQPDGKIYINSSDANFDLCRLYAYRPLPSNI